MSDIKREYFMFTNDGQKAFAALREKKVKGETNVGMAEVRFMLNPPKTSCKFCVFRIVED